MARTAPVSDQFARRMPGDQDTTPRYRRRSRAFSSTLNIVLSAPNLAVFKLGQAVFARGRKGPREFGAPASSSGFVRGRLQRRGHEGVNEGVNLGSVRSDGGASGGPHCVEVMAQAAIDEGTLARDGNAVGSGPLPGAGRLRSS